MAVGSFKDLNTVMYGQVNADLVNGSSEIAISTIGDRQFSCLGTSRIVHIPDMISCKGQSGIADFKCSDGRTAQATFITESCTSGRGEGRDSFGNPFGFVFGMDAEEAKQELQGQLTKRGIRQTPDFDRQIQALSSKMRQGQEAKIGEALGAALAIGLILYSGYQAGKVGAYADYNVLNVPTPQPKTNNVPQALHPTEQCSSNWDCQSGLYCLKAPGSHQGACVQSVNRFGSPTLERPTNNFLDKGVKQCNYDLDCPIGFRCHDQLKACVKRQ